MLTAANAVNAKFWNIWNQKDEEIIIESFMERMSGQMIISVIKRFLLEWFYALQLFIMVHTIKIILLITTMTILYYLAKKLWQGRPSYSKSNKKEENQKENTTIHVKVANTNNTTGQLGDFTNSNKSSARINLRGMINKPEILTDKADINIWMENLESYLESVEDQYWYKVKISYIDIKLVKELTWNQLKTKTNFKI